MAERFGYRLSEVGDIDAVHFWQMCAYINERPAPFVEMVETKRPRSGSRTTTTSTGDGMTETTSVRQPASMAQLIGMLDGVGKA